MLNFIVTHFTTGCTTNLTMVCRDSYIFLSAVASFKLWQYWVGRPSAQKHSLFFFTSFQATLHFIVVMQCCFLVYVVFSLTLFYFLGLVSFEHYSPSSFRFCQNVYCTAQDTGGGYTDTTTRWLKTCYRGLKKALKRGDYVDAHLCVREYAGTVYRPAQWRLLEANKRTVNVWCPGLGETFRAYGVSRMLALESLMWYAVVFTEPDGILRSAGNHIGQPPSIEKGAFIDQAISQSRLLYDTLPSRFKGDLSPAYLTVAQEIAEFQKFKKIQGAEVFDTLKLARFARQEDSLIPILSDFVRQTLAVVKREADLKCQIAENVFRADALNLFPSLTELQCDHILNVFVINTAEYSQVALRLGIVEAFARVLLDRVPECVSACTNGSQLNSTTITALGTAALIISEQLNCPPELILSANTFGDSLTQYDDRLTLNASPQNFLTKWWGGREERRLLCQVVSDLQVFEKKFDPTLVEYHTRLAELRGADYPAPSAELLVQQPQNSTEGLPNNAGTPPSLPSTLKARSPLTVAWGFVTQHQVAVTRVVVGSVVVASIFGAAYCYGPSTRAKVALPSTRTKVTPLSGKVK